LQDDNAATIKPTRTKSETFLCMICHSSKCGAPAGGCS
jgi:hypothetical protein